MRLAFITATPQNSRDGSGTFVGNARLADALRAQGHRVDFHTPTTRSGHFGFTLQRFSWNLGLNPRAFDACDAVIGLDMDGYAIARRVSAPFIAFIHGIIGDEATFERGMVRRSLLLQAAAERQSVRRARWTLTTSEFSRGRLAELYGIPVDRIGIVPQSVDLTVWDSALARINAPRATRPTVLCVGVQYPRKNVDTLVRAAAILVAEFPDLEVRIASKGPEWGRLVQLAASLGLQRTITFLGYVPFDALVEEYQRCNVFCLPSLQEGYGIVFAEAMATRRAIVACRASSTPEVIQDGGQGLLAEPRNPGDLAEKLAMVLRSQPLATRLGEAGRARIAQFDAPHCASIFIEQIRAVLPRRMLPNGS